MKLTLDIQTKAMTWSPPMRGRGLKLMRVCIIHSYDLVASHAGAWIETTHATEETVTVASPPMRGRGLKPMIWFLCCVMLGSPPMRGRGLKQSAP